MCGITGFWTKNSRYGFKSVLQAMNTAIAHRGPDAGAEWVDESAGIALGHRRLSIVDLSPAGAQPMASASGRYVIVYNGEIYNAPELRRALEPANWRGHSDTEVFLASIERYGLETTLGKLVGMFAFALWDKEERSLTLGRDRAGEKPLYYGWQEGVFLFGSELAALRAHPAFKTGINREALGHYFAKACVPGAESIFTGIHKLPPATTLKLDAKTLANGSLPAPQPYWSFAALAESALKNPYTGSQDEAVTELEALLRQSIQGQLISDVPLGAFLSGGVDSSLIVALMQQLSSQPVRSFTIGYEDAAMDESKDAAAVAKHLGTQHTTLCVTEADALKLIPDMANIYSEPFADSSSLPTALLSRLTRQSVTVALSGDAGDELFGGYNRYLAGDSVWQKAGFLPQPVRRALASVVHAIPAHRLDRLAAVAGERFNFIGDKLHKTATALTAANRHGFYQSVSSYLNPAEVMQASGTAPLLAPLGPQLSSNDNFTPWMMAQDFLTYLPDDILVKVDRAAMAYALESRAPYLDHRIIEFSLRLPLSYKIANGKGKWPLRNILYKYVPREMIERPKMGFGVPLDRWLRGALKDWASDLLSPALLQKQGYLRADRIDKIWQQHCKGGHNMQRHLWPVLMFQTWLQKNGQ